ncbi:MAG: hydroxyacid dehydrogenase [Candidatus Accumulibacter sp.]|jgi:(S)-sulfolactate dehydrogenase|nr:hydroxyacid dehydrogenase [Accumulibacter sp.]
MSAAFRSRILISEFMDEKAIDALRARYDVHYDPGLFGKKDELILEIRDAHALIVRNNTRVDARLIESAPKLRVVARLGVGLDNIDLESCGKRAIAVHPATGANARSVAEYTLAAILFLQRDVFSRSVETSAGKWPRNALSDTREAYGKTLGLVGFGNIGQRVAKLAMPFEMRVIATDPAYPDDSPVWGKTGVTPRALHDLLREADFVSLHLPLEEKTRGLFDYATLSSIKRGAFLINTARGGIVDEQGLARLLREGHLNGAVIDVFSREPLEADSPFANLPNVCLTPHIAGLTRESNSRVSAIAAERVDQTLRQQS